MAQRVIPLVGVLLLCVCFTESKTTNVPQAACPDFVSEGSQLSCTCRFVPHGPLTSFPTLTWLGHSDTSRLRLGRVERGDNGTTYRCHMVMGGESSFVDYTLQVAYGPSNVSISVSHTSLSSQKVTLTCQATEVNPQPSYSWSGVSCDNGNNGNVCVVTIASLINDVRTVMCTAVNVYVLPTGQLARASYILNISDFDSPTASSTTDRRTFSVPQTTSTLSTIAPQTTRIMDNTSTHLNIINTLTPKTPILNTSLEAISIPFNTTDSLLLENANTTTDAATDETSEGSIVWSSEVPTTVPIMTNSMTSELTSEKSPEITSETTATVDETFETTEESTPDHSLLHFTMTTNTPSTLLMASSTKPTNASNTMTSANTSSTISESYSPVVESTRTKPVDTSITMMSPYTSSTVAESSSPYFESSSTKSVDTSITMTSANTSATVAESFTPIFESSRTQPVDTSRPITMTPMHTPSTVIDNSNPLSEASTKQADTSVIMTSMSTSSITVKSSPPVSGASNATQTETNATSSISAVSPFTDKDPPSQVTNTTPTATLSIDSNQSTTVATLANFSSSRSSVTSDLTTSTDATAEQTTENGILTGSTGKTLVLTSRTPSVSATATDRIMTSGLSSSTEIMTSRESTTSSNSIPTTSNGDNPIVTSTSRTSVPPFSEGPGVTTSSSELASTNSDVNGTTDVNRAVNDVSDMDQFPVASFAGILAGVVIIVIFVIIIAVMCGRSRERGLTLVNYDKSPNSSGISARESYYQFGTDGYDKQTSERFDFSHPVTAQFSTFDYSAAMTASHKMQEVSPSPSSGSDVTNDDELPDQESLQLDFPAGMY